jgi:hypothetical protein
MDHRRLPRLCEPPPRLSHGSTQGNLIPLHLERKPEPGRWRRAALIALGIAVLAATALLTSGCTPERIVEPVPVPPPVCEWGRDVKCCIQPPNLGAVAMRDLGVRR